MSNPPETGFLHISFEIHLLIFSSLDPQDLIRLSQTCWSFHNIIVERKIWEDILRSICLEDMLFAPSFPIESMEVSDLQRAVLGPKRWIDMLSNAAKTDDSYPLPEPEHILGLPETDLVPDDGDYTRVYLVPGGRYLLAMTHARLLFWDLGVASRLKGVKAEPKCLSSVLSVNSFHSISPPALTTKHVRFLVLGSTDTVGSLIQVYEIGPLPQDFVIRRLAKVEIDCFSYDVTRFWIAGDLAFLRIKDTFVVWDFVRGVSRSWSPGFKVLEYTASNGMVIAFTDSKVYGWVIPTLQPIKRALSDSGARIPPSFQTSFGSLWPRSLAYNSSVSLMPQSWHTSPIYDIGAFVIDMEPIFTTWRFILDIAPDLRSAKVQLLSRFAYPVQSQAITHRLRPPAHRLRPLSVCSGSLETFTFTSDQYTATLNFVQDVHLLSSPMDESGLWKRISLGGLPHEVISLSLCPSSGRLAYACNGDHEDGFNGIHVFNLLVQTETVL